MNKIQKLTVDEKGKLHGGFSLQSIKDIGTVYGIADNMNCDATATGSGKNDFANYNCYCSTCDKDNGGETGGEIITPTNFICPIITPKP